MDSARSRILVLEAFSVPKTSLVSDTGVAAQFTRGYMSSFPESQARVLDPSYTTMGGVQALRFKLEVKGPDQVLYSSVALIFCNGYEYSLVVSSTAGRNLEDDREIQEAFDSFGFIGSPELHSATAMAPWQKISLPKHHLSLTIPGIWSQQTPENFSNKQAVWEAASSDRRRRVAIEVRPFPESIADQLDLHDKSIYTELEAGFAGSHVILTDRKLIQLSGRHALTYRASLTYETITVNFTLLIAEWGNALYVVSGAWREDDASAPAEIKSIIASLRFIGKH
jgi:hypothetical protein